MTLSKLQSELLKVCKYCDRFMDTGKKQNRYQCYSWKCSVFEAHNCRKNFYVRQQIKERKK